MQWLRRGAWEGRGCSSLWLRKRRRGASSARAARGRGESRPGACTMRCGARTPYGWAWPRWDRAGTAELSVLGHSTRRASLSLPLSWCSGACRGGGNTRAAMLRGRRLRRRAAERAARRMRASTQRRLRGAEDDVRGLIAVWRPSKGSSSSSKRKMRYEGIVPLRIQPGAVAWLPTRRERAAMNGRSDGKKKS